MISITDAILRNLMSHAASVYAVADDTLYLEAINRPYVDQGVA